MFDVAYWVKATQKVKFVEDVENIQLENLNIDEYKDVNEKPAYMKQFEDDFGEYMYDDQELFPEYEAITPVDPSTMQVKTTFSNKKSFIKYLRSFCVIHRCQCKLSRKYECEWFVHASKKKGESTFFLRKMNLEHKCVGDYKNRNRSVDPHFVKDFMLDQLKNSAKC
ncbi:hypothetical protein MKX01_005068 [Papaver californicum]|nr:hypothetical protein MKX01_005068 [Papaver californicum]